MPDTVAVPVVTGLSATSSKMSRMRSLKWSILGRDRSLPHLQRKIYHFVMGMVCFSLYAFFLDRSQALFVLTVVGGTWVVLDLFRLYVPSMNALTLKLFGKIMRRDELKSVSGNSFYILGLMVTILFFPKPIVLLSTLFLAIGDPTAAIAGTLYGKHRLLGKKSWEGTAANFVLTWIAVLAVGLTLFNLSLSQAAGLAWIGASVSAVAELLPLPIDDNFTIPVASACLLSLFQPFLPFV